MRHAVVGDRLPRHGVGDELPPRGADAGIAVEDAEPDREHVRILRMAAPERAAARAAEDLHEAVGRPVVGDQLLAGDDAQRAGDDAAGDRRRGSGTALAARAVAVAGVTERLRHLEAHAAAEAAPGEHLARLAFGEPLEPVVRDRLPLGRIRDERAELRLDPVARVEGAEADAHHLAALRVLAPERAAAVRAEALGEPVRRPVLADELRAGEQAERPGREPRLRRGGRAGAALAARAVAIPRGERRCGHLVADAAAEAAAAERELGHVPPA